MALQGSGVRRVVAVTLLACASLAALSVASLAEELPLFRKGLWQFKRSVHGGAAPQEMTTQKCTSPSDDMRARNEKAAHDGCKVSPLTRSGSSYHFTFECVLQGTSISSDSVITVESDSAYHVEIDSRVGSAHTKESLDAKRLGDC